MIFSAEEGGERGIYKPLSFPLETKKGRIQNGPLKVKMGWRVLV